jgi:hypothetical protein
LVLVVAWLLAALRANGPYPLFGDLWRAGLGEDDPLQNAQSPDRSQRRAGADARAGAHDRGHQFARACFDNVSGLLGWLSDALCRLASGGSLSVWQRYTDDEKVLLQAARPVVINGVEDCHQPAWPRRPHPLSHHPANQEKERR